MAMGLVDLVGRVIALPLQYAILVPILLATYISFLVIRERHLSPLAKVPGPWLASISKYWFISNSLKGDQHTVHLKCHEKYGPLWRAMPNYVLVNDAAFMQIVYKWDRTDWYRAFDVKGHYVAAAATRTMEEHNAKRKRVGAAYSMTSILQMEPHMDELITLFISQLSKKYAKTGKKCNLTDWAQWLAFDVVMNLAFSEPIGFVKEGRDVNDTVVGLQGMFQFAILMVNLPGLVKFIQQPWLYKLIGPKTTDKKGPGFVQGLGVNAVQKRIERGNVDNRRDLVQLMIEYEDSKGAKLTPKEMEAECYSAIGAGSDTTSVAIRGAILYITTNPHVYIRLMDEISAYETQHGLSSPVSFKQCQGMPYLNAICKEVLRLNSPVGTPFPRLVPKGGITIANHFLPEGTEVGINSWCIARNPAIYGEDVNVFRPERWLESEEQTKYFEKVDISFGTGYTQCLGKNIAIMEMQKTVVELLRHFEISVANPEKPWRMENLLAILIWDFNVFLKPREKRWAEQKI